MKNAVTEEYAYQNSQASHTQAYLWPVVMRLLASIRSDRPKSRVLDLGCGNGAFTRELSEAGYPVVGVDASKSGIDLATQAWPEIEFHVGSAYDDLASMHGMFDVVVSLEVVEHLYSPKQFASRVMECLTPGGTAIISTPFHGYWKNLLLALTGNMDQHFTVLWDHGHIKFWSVRTLTELLLAEGFEMPSFDFAGRFYPFSKSMVAVATKPTVAMEDS